MGVRAGAFATRVGADENETPAPCSLPSNSAEWTLCRLASTGIAFATP